MLWFWGTLVTAIHFAISCGTVVVTGLNLVYFAGTLKHRQQLNYWIQLTYPPLSVKNIQIFKSLNSMWHNLDKQMQVEIVTCYFRLFRTSDKIHLSERSKLSSLYLYINCLKLQTNAYLSLKSQHSENNCLLIIANSFWIYCWILLHFFGIYKCIWLGNNVVGLLQQKEWVALSKN